MNKVKLSYVFFYILIITNYLQAQPLVELDFNVVASIPAPGPSSSGLTWDGNNLWVVDDSTKMIYKLNSSKGTVLDSFNSPGNNPTGLTYDGEYLWNLDDTEKLLFKLNRESGEILDTLKLPNEVNGVSLLENDVSGLAWDGVHLWSAFSAGWSSSAFSINPNNGSVDTSFFCTANDLTFDGINLWTLHNQTSYTSIVSSWIIPSGKEIAFLRIPYHSLTGITHSHNFSFWLVDSSIDSLFMISMSTTDINNYHNSSNSVKYFLLYQNYPNPFNPSTQLSYQIPKDGFVSLVVYNTLGQVVSTLVNEHQTSGKYSVQFNASNLPSGVYFYKIESGRFTKVNKMLLLR
ncbi:MAG: T9SS type A sorting domain-containing protein [Melioribacteraceae bacterium]|nr:T9SS type A sorting domain-containing protein [Melioribacteraceae bacterium]